MGSTPENKKGDYNYYQKAAYIMASIPAFYVVQSGIAFGYSLSRANIQNPSSNVMRIVLRGHAIGAALLMFTGLYTLTTEWYILGGKVWEVRDKEARD